MTNWVQKLFFSSSNVAMYALVKVKINLYMKKKMVNLTIKQILYGLLTKYTD